MCVVSSLQEKIYVKVRSALGAVDFSNWFIFSRRVCFASFLQGNGAARLVIYRSPRLGSNCFPFSDFAARL
jgi:hypothetical protein